MSDYRIRQVASNLGFIEGPVALADGRLVVLDMISGHALFVDPSTGAVNRKVHLGGGPNGAATGPDGSLFVCNNGGHAFTTINGGFHFPILDGTPAPDPRTPGIYRVELDGTVTPLYTNCDGRALQAPNDLVFDSHGGFYFTDTGREHERLCDLGGLYYAQADGSRIVELIHESAPAAPLTQPNGVALAPAGDRIYVAETVTARVWTWNIGQPGVLEPAPNAQSSNGAACLYGKGGNALFDSMAVDSAGYICVGTLLTGGLTVIAPDGRLEAFIELPEFDPLVTNICFGGKDLRTAFVTAAGRGKLWAIDWPRPGLQLNYADTPG